MPKYDFDPDFAEFIPNMPTVQDFSTLEAIKQVRAARMLAQFASPDRDDVAVDERQIPGYKDSPDVTIRVYRPTTASEKPLPAILEIHGGGFMLGNLEMMHPWCQMIAAKVETLVISVDYRLAPEHPYPAALHDCYSALLWAAEQADSLGIDGERIAIAGQSAGAGLAAGTALLARDENGPAIAFQLLEVPEIDDRLDTPSMLAFQDTPFWNRPNAIWSWRHYLGPDHVGEVGEAGEVGEPPIYAAPARATDLRGLPPTYISTMEFDPLRDEGLRYGMSLLQAGVSVELHNYAGTFHGSAFIATAEPSRRNADEIVAILKRRLHG